MKFGEVFNLILKIILVLLAILIIVWALQLLFGGSPSVEEFNFALIILLASFIMHMYREVGIIKNDSKHSFSNIKNSFVNIKGDMTDIKKDMSLIKKRLKI